VVQTVFQKHQTHRNIAYVPTGIGAITPGANVGERFAMYFPESPTGLDPLLIVLVKAGSLSASTKSDATEASLTSADGFPWQAAMRGCKVAFCQVTTNVNGATYSGEGCWEPPGTAGGWESGSTNDATSMKDASYMVAHFRAFWRTYGIDPNAIAVWGSSAGNINNMFNAYGRNMRGIWGAGGQHNVSTRPNCVIGQHTVLVTTKIFDQAAASNALAANFESVATPGTLADTFDDVPDAYQRAVELINWCPFWNTGRAPPSYFQGDTNLGSARFSEPFEAGVLAVNQGHSMFGAVALKANFPQVRVALADAITKTGLTLGIHYDAIEDDIMAPGVAGETTGPAIDFLMGNIREPELRRLPDEVWTYTGACLTTGWRAIPSSDTGRARTLRVACTHATNALRFGPSQDLALSYAFPTGIPVEIRTSGQLWIKSNEATASSYIVEEYD
jgi:hypothetical protein